MKLTKQKLLDLIQEQLMLEVLDSEPYPFKIYDGPNYLDDNSRMSVEYLLFRKKARMEENFAILLNSISTKRMKCMLILKQVIFGE